MNNRRWRSVDIVIASVLGVVIGLIFLIWNNIGFAWYSAADALTPGLGGLATGIWVIGGVVGGLVIRKPGAALYVELLAAVTSVALGNQWSIEAVFSGLAQGLGAEIAFAVFAYNRFGIWVSILAGVLASWGEFGLELFTRANLQRSTQYLLTYASCMTLSGILLAGVLGYYLVHALAQTGVLDRFAVGQERFSEPLPNPAPHSETLSDRR